jgi:hypothetical protein
LLTRPGGWHRLVRELFETLTYPQPIHGLGLLLLAGVVLPDTGLRQPRRALACASLIGTALLVHSVNVNAVDQFVRYVFAFTTAAALATITHFLDPVNARPAWRRWGARAAQTLAACVAVFQLFEVRASAVNLHMHMTTLIAKQLSHPAADPRHSPLFAEYRALQNSIPPHERMLVMVDFPFLFDYGRNEIHNVDTAAAFSPPPGVPFFRGAEPLASYLQGVPIRYVAVVDPTRALELFRRDAWVANLHGPIPVYAAQAPFYLDLIDNFDRLASSRARVYDDGTLRMLDLSARR